MIFSEVSPRPHDTGMVTLISQDLSEFALHVRAFLGLPVGGIRQYGPAASAVILPQLTSQNVTFDNVQNAVGADLQIRLFGKPEIDGSRRLGVALATAESVVDAIKRAKHGRRTGKSTGLNPAKKRYKNARSAIGHFDFYSLAPSTASRASLVIRS